MFELSVPHILVNHIEIDFLSVQRVDCEIAVSIRLIRFQVDNIHTMISPLMLSCFFLLLVLPPLELTLNSENVFFKSRLSFSLLS